MLILIYLFRDALLACLIKYFYSINPDPYSTISCMNLPLVFCMLNTNGSICISSLQPLQQKCMQVLSCHSNAIGSDFRITEPVVERNFGLIEIDWNSSPVSLAG